MPKASYAAYAYMNQVYCLTLQEFPVAKSGRLSEGCSRDDRFDFQSRTWMFSLSHTCEK